MRIGIDARTILNPEKGEAIGVGHYTYQLIRHLIEIDKENEYVLFFDFRVREKDVKKFTRPNVKVRFYPFSDYRKYLPGAYNEILGRATLVREKLDILHSTSALNRIPAGYRGKVIVTFHDLAYQTLPECFPRVRKVRNRAVASLMAKKAEKIIAVSEAMKSDLEKFMNVAGSKIEVIHSGLDKRFFDDAGPDRKAIEKLGVNGKYVLFLGTLEPSKNITRLLEAFARFKERTAPDSLKDGSRFPYQLVIAGKRGWLSQEYPQMVKDLGLQKEVVFTGYIVGDELVPLFKGADFFVLPSLYEGFGTTLLEAFATGTPAIASNVGSLPEIADDAAYFVNPVSVDEIADAMAKFSQDPGVRDKYRQKGLARAKNFDWEKCARETLEVYKRVANG